MFYESTLDLIVLSAALTGNKLNVSFTTRARLNLQLDAGDITAQRVEIFHTAALKFWMRTEAYALIRLPLRDALLKQARFVDVRQRAECGEEDAFTLWRDKISMFICY